MDLRPHPEQIRAAPKFFTVWVPIFGTVYLAVLLALGGLGPEHLLLVALALALSLWSESSRRIARIGLPYLLYGLVYDSMRWYEDYIRSPIIHVREPYDFDLRFFGIHGQTPNEWFQQHTSAALDFICGLAYTPLFFIGECIVLSIYFLLTGEERRGVRFTWIFVIANFIGFSCYYIYPAAPPWYVTDHGFAVDMSVRASAAGALRFDTLVGLPIMRGFYGKSADVFGAIPSLHVVYPFLAMVYGWHLRRFRLVAIAYFLLICFAAVYLNHHYLIDIFIGLGIALAVMAAARILFGSLSGVAADRFAERQAVAREQAREAL
ncbi:MAG: inositol phosphorylceramide synthase [Deltaproteobacteria bacterium]|nr:MAG: inositol phosphorylceramide synthase [Deltaproteobacteria bacterium]